MPKSIALVVGVSTGIGKALFQEFSRDYEVWGTSRFSNNDNILMLDFNDLSTIDQCIQLLKTKLDGGRIKLLVLNSGVAYPTSILDCDPKRLKQIFNINVLGHALLIKQLIGHLENQARILFINSKSSLVTLPFLGIYAATKKALLALSQALRYELSAFDIQVTSLCLGNIRTRLWTEVFSTKQEVLLDDGIYGKQLAKSFQLAEEKFQKAKTTEELSKWILKLVSKEKLKPIYHYGMDTKLLVFIKKLLPNKYFELLIKKQYDF